MRFVTWWKTRIWRWQVGLVLAALILAASALVDSISNIADEANEHRNDAADRAQISRLSQELECRSQAATEASNIQGEIGRATALGLVAVARGDDRALTEQADRIEALALELGPALVRRAEAVEECEAEANE